MLGRGDWMSESRIRELELQVAYLRGYSKISQEDFEKACERYGMGKAVEQWTYSQKKKEVNKQMDFSNKVSRIN